MASASKTIIIDFIVSCLEKGEQRATILAKVVKKWQISSRTFDRLLQTASQQHTATQASIKKAKAAIDILNGVEERTRQIADVTERKEILTKIVRGQIPLSKPMVVKGKLKMVKTVPDWMDRKAAIAELNKMDGSYAPDKVANTDTEGNDILSSPILTDNQFDKLIQTIHEASTSQG